MNWHSSFRTGTRGASASIAAALLFLASNNVVASPESPTPSPTPILAPKATPTAPAESIESQSGNQAVGESLSVKFNQEFKLGDYSYKIEGRRFLRRFTHAGRRKVAPEGAVYVELLFQMRYDGKQTVSAEDSFGTMKLVDFQGREYRPDRNVGVLVKDIDRQAFHPGVFTKLFTPFEVPIESAKSGIYLVIHRGTETATIPLTYTPSPTPSPKPTRKGAKRIRQDKREPVYPSRPVSPGTSAKPTSSDWGTTRVLVNGHWIETPVYYGVYRRKEQIGLEQEQRGEDNITSEQQELWRRMSRPPGVPWRNFSTLDQYGYPNN